MSKRKVVIFICLFLIPFFIYSQQGRIEQGKIFSSILKTEKEYSIYLPPNYDSSTVKYPVLYLLHGAWGEHRDWATRGNISYLTDKTIKEGKSLPMIIVMPDASGTRENHAGDHMGYFNYQDWKYQDFFIQELIPFIEQKYRAKGAKTNRAIAGLSMGGGGSVIFAQKYPDYFGTACSLSGLLMDSHASPSEDINSAFIEKMREDDQTVFVTKADSIATEKLKTVRWYVDCGDDDYLIKGNISFFMAMKEKHIPLEFRINDGEHRWEYWQAGIIEVLQYISIGFANSDSK